MTTSTIGKPEVAAGSGTALGALLALLPSTHTVTATAAQTTSDVHTGALVAGASLGLYILHQIATVLFGPKTADDVESRLASVESRVEEVATDVPKAINAAVATLPQPDQADAENLIARAEAAAAKIGDEVKGWVDERVSTAEDKLKDAETKAAAKVGVDPAKLRSLLDEALAAELPAADVAEADKVVAAVTPSAASTPGADTAQATIPQVVPAPPAPPVAPAV